ncbi:MAG: protein-glutamate O-methyltransferase CheR [Myxococcales bacterium]|nr:protein-glutamate O-methyltransferase CheR [Myxococcales bacterium]
MRGFVRDRAGIHLTDAKWDLVYGRVSRRVRALDLNSFSAYLDRVRSGDSTETEHLLNAITTNVTAFFREQHHFEHLQAVVSAGVVRDRPMKIWSSACSTGEEPYSIAMTLLDSSQSDFMILATDLDTRVLEVAALGVYDASKVDAVGPELTRRYFRRGRAEHEGKLKVKPELQDRIRFKQVNLMADWPIKGPLDVIFCRNVLIYFEKKDQIRLFRSFADVLRPGGFLYLGHSESVSGEPRLHAVARTTYERIS